MVLSNNLLYPACFVCPETSVPVTVVREAPEMPVEELPLEMRIDLEIRDVLIRHKTTAWDIMETDILDGIKRQRQCSSHEIPYDISATGALKDWLYVMESRCLRPDPSEAEAESEQRLMRLLRDHGIYALKVMADRIDDLKKHVWYASEEAKGDIGRRAALDDWIKKYTWYPNNREFLEIEYAYKSGEFRDDEQDLYAFVKTHREDIEACRESWQSRIKSGKQISLLDATRLLFFKKQSVNPRRDMLLQKGEIDKEIESQHANDEDTRVRIARDYGKNRAADWRDRKVKIIEYILTIHADKVLKLLNETPKLQLEYANAG